MVLQEQATQTDQHKQQTRKFCGLTVQNLLQFLSSLILPLMLGIFTVAIALYQQNVTMKQRAEDRQLAREQRLEDRNESQQQRAQELHVLTVQHENQSKASSDRYRDEVLFTYIKEIGELLEKYSGSLTLNPVTNTLARVKTLNAIRQLDGSRNMHIIRFLYEAGQLTQKTDSDALDIATAELLHLDFISLAATSELTDLSLTGVTLESCTFDQLELQNVDFHYTSFEVVSFISTSLSYVNFSNTIFSLVVFTSATLDFVDFSDAEIEEAEFSNAELNNVNFLEADLIDVSGQSVEFYDVDFSFTKFTGCMLSPALFEDVNFSSADFSKVDLSLTTLDTIDFSEAELKNVDFSSAELSNVDFSFSTLRKIDLSSAKLYNVDFSSSTLKKIDFSLAELDEVDFSFAEELHTMNFSFATLLDNIDFSFSRLDSATFRFATMSHTNFVQTQCIMADFDHADLSMSVFWHANAKDAFFTNADLTNVNFSLANLRKADFTNTSITESQLQSALSIRNARLPNGTLGRAPNLIKNGHAHCDISFIGNWQLQNGNITAIPLDANSSDCQFAVQSDVIGGIMSQKINLASVWNSTIWKYSRAVLAARMTSGVTIHLSGTNKKGKTLRQQFLNSTQSNVTMVLNKEMKELEVLVKFSSLTERNNRNRNWCDNIELFLDYDTEEIND